ncbi:hypothetical protein [Sphingobacterium sp.]|uniref:hypothetical protein n=1 Tax=Sphingobacterium sp. TaxID=341027 RepID=UPI0028981CD8|nr:hypothetical protein [Sphingobacterium sp.]
MEFKLLEEVIEGITIDLNVLKRNSEPYSMLLYQHEGILHATDERIGNMTDSSIKLASFFNLLKIKNVDFGLIPEYCCPFNSISEIIKDNRKWPSSKSLWTIGMESISINELTTFVNGLPQGTICYYDNNVLDVAKNFLDPLIYLFKGVRHGQEGEQLIILIQFKNLHMGVWSGGDIERDNIIPGNEIYVLRNDERSVHLMTLICSEAMNLNIQFDAEYQRKFRWGDSPFLVLNPQVNPGPTHSNFLGFRNFVLNNQRTEVVGLNWNSNSMLGTHDLISSGSSRSGIYTRSTEVNFKNLKRIKENHKKGMYYYFYGIDRHAFLLNSKAHAFLIQNTPVHINAGVMQQQMRNGPHLISSYLFDDQDQLQEVNELSDSHIDYLTSVGCTNDFLLSPENCIIEKELLTCLSTGEVFGKQSINWSEVNNIWSFKSTESSDISRRITVGEDLNDESTRLRNRYVDFIEILGTEILKNPDFLPDSLSNLKTQTLDLGYSKELDPSGEKLVRLQYFRCNLKNIDGNMVWATVCYVGTATDDQIGRTFKALQELFDFNSKNRERVVVFYKRKGKYHAKSSDNSNRINEVNVGSENSFLK